jgi:hypothetical protein
MTDFRLLDHPQGLVKWQHNYLNRTFNLPSYRTVQGNPLPGWRCQVIGTRRFFTNQSAKIYYRIEDLHQTTIFGSTTALDTMRIWPVGAILVLETYSGKAANTTKQSPLFIDCIRKFEADVRHFPEDTLFAGEWSYQRFDVKGKVLQMVGGASACHQCHATAFRLTGDLVFTLFSQDEAVEKEHE